MAKPNFRKTSPTRRVAKVPGQPGMPLAKQTFSVKGFTPTLKPIFRKRSVRVLLKRDPKLGITQPEAAKMTTTHGVDTGSGFATPAREISKAAMAAPGANQRVIPTPRAGQGKVKVFNKVRSVRGSRQRFK